MCWVACFFLNQELAWGLYYLLLYCFSTVYAPALLLYEKRKRDFFFHCYFFGFFAMWTSEDVLFGYSMYTGFPVIHYGIVLYDGCANGIECRNLKNVMGLC